MSQLRDFETSTRSWRNRICISKRFKKGQKWTSRSLSRCKFRKRFKQDAFTPDFLPSPVLLLTRAHKLLEKKFIEDCTIRALEGEEKNWTTGGGSRTLTKVEDVKVLPTRDSLIPFNVWTRAIGKLLPSLTL